MVLWLLIQLPTYFQSVTTGNTASLGKGHVLQGGKCLGFGSFEGSTFGWDVYEEHVHPSACSELSWANPFAESSDLGDKGSHGCAVGGDQPPGQASRGRESLCPLKQVPDSFPVFVLLQTLGYQRHFVWGHLPAVDGVQLSCVVELNSSIIQHVWEGRDEGVSTAQGSNEVV